MRSLRKYKESPAACDETRTVCTACASSSRYKNLPDPLDGGHRRLAPAHGGACADTSWMANVSDERVCGRTTLSRPVWNLSSRSFRIPDMVTYSWSNSEANSFQAFVYTLRKEIVSLFWPSFCFNSDRETDAAHMSSSGCSEWGYIENRAKTFSHTSRSWCTSGN